jgi:hypothetical protein
MKYVSNEEQLAARDYNFDSLLVFGLVLGERLFSEGSSRCR